MLTTTQELLVENFVEGTLVISVTNVMAEIELASILFKPKNEGGLGFEENRAMTKSVITDRGVSYHVKIWSDKKSVGVIHNFSSEDDKVRIVKAEDFINLFRN
jgi:hypothetical protein